MTERSLLLEERKLEEIATGRAEIAAGDGGEEMATATRRADVAVRATENAGRTPENAIRAAACVGREKIRNTEDAVRAAIRTAMQTERFRGKKMERRQSL